MPRGSISGSKDAPKVEPPADWPNFVPPASRRHKDDPARTEDINSPRTMSRAGLHDFLLRLAKRVKPD